MSRNLCELQLQVGLFPNEVEATKQLWIWNKIQVEAAMYFWLEPMDLLRKQVKPIMDKIRRKLDRRASSTTIRQSSKEDLTIISEQGMVKNL